MIKLLPLLFLSTLALAQTTSTTSIRSIGGASNTGQETDGTWIVYAGLQGGASWATFGCTAAQACDTCVGSPGAGMAQYPCNIKGVFPDTTLIFDVTSTETSGTKYILCNAGQEVGSSVDRQTPLVVTWGSVCSKVTGNTSDCDEPLNQTMQLGVGTSCSSIAAQINVKFISRTVDVTTASAYVPDAANCNTANTYGACFFKLFPGDNKMYLHPASPVGVVSNFPATNNSNIKYTYLAFMYKATGTADPTDTSNDVATFNSITTGDPITTIALTTTGEPAGKFIEGEGINNDVRYCFKMGSMDSTGNIELISHTDCTTPGADCENVCGSPSEVLGLLADKNCFIATAAYGSTMNQHVNTLRTFRDQFMVSNWFGRKLVKAYYKLSPPLAQWVSENEIAKSFVRAFLWPIVAWVTMALAWGWAGLLAPVALLTGSVLLIRRRLRS